MQPSYPSCGSEKQVRPNKASGTLSSSFSFANAKRICGAARLPLILLSTSELRETSVNCPTRETLPERNYGNYISDGEELGAKEILRDLLV